MPSNLSIFKSLHQENMEALLKTLVFVLFSYHNNCFAHNATHAHWLPPCFISSHRSLVFCHFFCLETGKNKTVGVGWKFYHLSQKEATVQGFAERSTTAQVSKMQSDKVDSRSKRWSTGLLQIPDFRMITNNMFMLHAWALLLWLYLGKIIKFFCVTSKNQIIQYSSITLHHCMLVCVGVIQ